MPCGSDTRRFCSLRLPRGVLARKLNERLRRTPWHWFLHAHFPADFRRRAALLFLVVRRLSLKWGCGIPSEVTERLCALLSQLERRRARIERLLDE